MTGVPVMVLAYHSISAGPAPLCIAPESFEAQLELLRRSGYRALRLADVVESVESGRFPSAPSFALTFDDAYRDFAEVAAPILERRGLPAVLYATAAADRRLPGGTGAPLLELRELAPLVRRGVEIGSHAVRHVDLTRVDDAALERELADSRSILEEHAGRAVEHFAYPFGRFDARVRAAVARRFRSAVTTQLARAGPGDDRLAIPRIDAHYLRSPLSRFLLARGRLEPYLRVRRRLRRARGSESRSLAPDPEAPT